jgi:hypothetical protein
MDEERAPRLPQGSIPERRLANGPIAGLGTLGWLALRVRGEALAGALVLVATRRHRGQSEEVEIERGALVWTIAEDQQRHPARVVIGPHWSGEFEVVVLCEPEDWETVQAERRPTDDYWGEACFVWPVEAIERAAPNNGFPSGLIARRVERAVAVDLIVGTERLGYPPPPTGWRRWLPWETQTQLVYDDRPTEPTAPCHLQVAEDQPALCGYQWECLVTIPNSPTWADIDEIWRCQECSTMAERQAERAELPVIRTPDDNLNRFRSSGSVTVVSAETQQFVHLPVDAVEAVAPDERRALRTSGEPGWFDPEPIRDELRLVLGRAAASDRAAVQQALSEADYACRYGTGIAVVPPQDVP